MKMYKVEIASLMRIQFTPCLSEKRKYMLICCMNMTNWIFSLPVVSSELSMLDIHVIHQLYVVRKKGRGIITL